MTTAIKTIERDGIIAKLYVDEDATSPDDWDNLATIEQCSGFRMGTSVGGPARGEDWATYARWLTLSGTAVAVLPIRIGDGHAPYETNGASATGVMYVTDARLTELCGDGPEYHTREWAEQALRGELDVWRQYFEGDVYGYNIEGFDSCWGLYGFDYAMTEAGEALDAAIIARKERAEEVTRGWAIAHGLTR